jgi:hypothetical protein
MLTAVSLNGGLHYYDLIPGSRLSRRPLRSTILTSPLSFAYFHYWRGNDLAGLERYADALASLEVIHGFFPGPAIVRKIRSIEEEMS